ncbi:hypothetical protein N864_20920 [Intrasporangium chromatireducens Q5-1]|uniref:Uncharacterized protein n=1 Tax=Intrasporangium chromatireducens Q5-1 TaxID=584657 RepID=W9GJU9_9MICO|nr:hypothetical protein [Intrasporangium chromatireducens]EWT06496.1 hypothetical protein N864_20920 [Intrasporangium chromatireducens Q5-1]
MGEETEAESLAEVQTRLQERFPGLSPTVVEAAVRTAHASLDGPIRDFVPVLVEHAAQDRLAALAPAEEEVGPQVELE